MKNMMFILQKYFLGSFALYKNNILITAISFTQNQKACTTFIFTGKF